MKRAPAAVDHWAALVDVVVLSSILFALLLLGERSRLMKVMFWAVSIALLANLRSYLAKAIRIGLKEAKHLQLQPVLAVAAVLLAIGVIYLVAKKRSSLRELVVAPLVMLAPFGLLMNGRAVHGALTAAHASTLQDQPVAPPPRGASASNYVVWLIFDELDYALAFADRPTTIDLPELDRLRSESIFAQDARSPAIVTLRALPSLLTGRVVEEAVRKGQGELELKFEDDGQPVRWSEVPTIFDSVRAMGAETGLVGWYHPYCRILAARLTRCRWHGEWSVLGQGEQEPSLLETMTSQAAGIFRFDRLRRHLVSYDSVLEDTMAALEAQRSGLLFIHLPVPHLPAVYDVKAQRRSVFLLDQNPDKYAGNLVLADRAFGELRRKMEALKVWERAHVIVSSDHPFRTEVGGKDQFVAARDPRIPFMIKVAGQREGRVHERPYSSVRTHGIVEKLVARTQVTEDEVMEWMARESEGVRR